MPRTRVPCGMVDAPDTVGARGRWRRMYVAVSGGASRPVGRSFPHVQRGVRPGLVPAQIRESPGLAAGTCRRDSGLQRQGGSCGGDGLDAVGAEAGPVVLAGHDDGGLLVAEALNEGEGFRVLGDVDLLVGDALLVEGAVGRVALGAAGLGVDGDRHVRVSLRLEAGRWHPVLSFWRLVRREHDNTTPRGRPRKRPLDVVCAAPTVDETGGLCGWSERSGSQRGLCGLSTRPHGCAKMRANIGVCD